jgi:hypothetical protein
VNVFGQIDDDGAGTAGAGDMKRLLDNARAIIFSAFRCYVVRDAQDERALRVDLTSELKVLASSGQAPPVDYLLRCESWRESYSRVHVVERMHDLGDVFSNVAQTPLGQCFSGRAAIRQWGFA